MKFPKLSPVAAALALSMSAPAFAAGIDFSGSNIYMKFLDGDQRRVSLDSGDTASGTDNGQWTEFELRIKATISKQVEAGVRLQSRSPAAYWTDFGFADETAPTRSKFVKLRGAYVLLTPGYRWLDQALIGSTDWGYFDPFTIGKVRYIDRDNYNGIYLKGPLPLAGSSWEFARLSLPNYLQSNYGQGPSCCTTDSTQFNEAVYIGQLRGTFGPARLATSYQVFDDHKLATDPNEFDGRDRETFAKNNVFMLKGEASVLDGVDVRGAYYRSKYSAPLFDQPWINSPKSSINDDAFKFDVEVSALPVPGLSFAYQYFNIGAGFYSNTAARRESDVLLTEGSEAAWFNWGQAIWLGGAAKDYDQVPSSMGSTIHQPSANGLVDNAFIDFDEAPSESVQGWKGHTVIASYEIAKTPMSLEYTRIDYNNNWQNYSPTGPLSNYFALNSDRKTNIAIFRVSRVLPVAGGLELGFKYKRVDDKNRGQISNATDDRNTLDSGYTVSVGNQLFGDLYGSLSYGRYSRDITLAGRKIDNDKSIVSLRLAYNLAGFELGTLAQWIDGKGDPTESGNRTDIKQYRLKTFAKVIF